MLDLRSPINLPDLPDIVIHRDDRLPLGFYAWPKAPRIVVDDASRLVMRLLVFGKDEGGVFTPSGATLSLTAGLELTGLETQQLRAALEAWLVPTPSDTTPPVEPELLSAQWVDGGAQLRLGPERILTGRPSLYSGNHTVFNVMLGAGEVGPFLDAWQGRLEGASLSYSMRVRALPGPAAVTLTFSGRLMPPGATPEDYVTRVSL